MLKNSFETIDDKTYYYIKNVKVTGFRTIAGDTYYFNNDGKMQTGEVTIDGTTYYFDDLGILKGSKTYEV